MRGKTPPNAILPDEWRNASRRVVNDTWDHKYKTLSEAQEASLTMLNQCVTEAIMTFVSTLGIDIPDAKEACLRFLANDAQNKTKN